LNLLGGGNGGNGGGSPSAASTADQSSTADPFLTYNDEYYNDKTSLLKSSSSGRPTTPTSSITPGAANHFNNNNNGDGGGGAGGRPSWYMETMPEEESAEQFTTTSNANNGRRSFGNSFDGYIDEKKMEMETEETNPNPILLSFPTPKDRSHDARRHQSQSMGQMHAYDGELEPEGVRGQEAKVLKSQSREDNGQVPLRSFDGSSPPPMSQQQPQQQQLGRSNSRRQMQLREKITTASRNSSTTNNNNEDGGQFNSSPAAPFIVNDNTPRQQLNPPSRMESNNDDEYQQMLKDNIAEIVQQQHEEDLASNSQHRLRQNQNRQMDGNRNNNGSIDMGNSFDSPKPQAHATRGGGNEVGPTTPTGAGDGANNNRSVDNGAEPPSPESRVSNKSNRRSAPVDVDEGSFQDPLSHVQGIHAMAMEHVVRGEYDMALQAFSEVLRVYLKQHGKAHPLTASAYHNLGTVHTKRAGLLLDHTLHQRHCREQALLCFQAAARSARDSPQLGPDHPNVAVSLVRIGFLLLQSRQYQNAVITFEEALRIRLDHYGPTHGLVANLYNNLGVCCMHLHNFTTGRRYLQQALDIQKELLNREDSSETDLLELADTLCNIGGLNLEWIRQQGPDARHALDAESAFLEALELRSEVLGPEHPLTQQVRSLHDMVRSIPLPNVDDVPETQGTGAGNARTASDLVDNNPKEYASDDISAMTGTPSVPATPKSMQKYTGTLLPPATPSTADELHLPSLDRSIDKSNSSHNFLPSRSKHLDAEASLRTRTAIEAYDATEESCLLRRPGNGTSSQVGLVVTYAQTATNGTIVESDRSIAMNQAKAILDAHSDIMDSPSGARAGGSQMTMNSGMKPSSEDDGLVPLAGNWPPASFHQITPEVLENPEEHLHTIQNCASNFMRRGRYTEAVQLLEIVVECQKARNGPVHEDVGDALHNVGIAELRAEEYYQALQAFEEAVRVRKGALGNDHAQVAVSLMRVGISLLLLQRLDDALWIFREALTVRKNALGALHPSNARIWNNIGCVHVEFNELKEARRSFESALDIQRNALVNDPENGPIMFGASTTLQNLGYLYAKREMYEKAAMVLRESLTLQEKVMEPDHPSVLNTLESLAEACMDARRYPHASRYYEELLKRYEGSDSSESTASILKQASLLQKIGSIHMHQNDPQMQLMKLQMAIQLLRSDSTTVLTEQKLEEERAALDKKIMTELRLVESDIGRSNNGQGW